MLSRELFALAVLGMHRSPLRPERLPSSRCSMTSIAMHFEQRTWVYWLHEILRKDLLTGVLRASSEKGKIAAERSGANLWGRGARRNSLTQEILPRMRCGIKVTAAQDSRLAPGGFRGRGMQGIGR